MSHVDDPVEAVFWVLLLAGVLFAVAYAASELRVFLRRRAQRARYRRAGHESQTSASARLVADQGISPERAASISRDAEDAARSVAHGECPHVDNPHAARTREFVLWEATYLSAMSDFSELRDHPHDPPAPAPRA